MMNMDSNTRFDRLEAKIDKLADAMVMLIKHGTKIETLEAHNNTQDNRLNKHSAEIDAHSVELAVVAKASGTNEWFIRLLIAALVAGVAYIVRG